MEVLIFTVPNDIHAALVKLALEKSGHACTLMYSADFPSQQRQSLLFGKSINWHIKGIEIEIDTPQFDVVWNRRLRAPLLKHSIHPGDYEIALKENIAFFQGYMSILAPNAVWVNPYESSKKANLKTVQLQLAHALGLKIPDTLISNDPDRIKKFIQGSDSEQVIYKSFLPLYWSEERNIRQTFTRPIQIHDLPGDKILQAVPGIYQKKMEKLFELRITYFGEQCIAVKINSQKHSNGSHDWREIPTHELEIEPYPLPETIHLKCKELMQKLGLVFGCFDFIVTPEGEHIFLEINEQGQFLWIEDLDPTFKMLNTFVNFLIQQGTHDTAYLNSDIQTVQALEVEANSLVANSMNTHVNN